MTQSHEGETVIYSDRRGNPVPPDQSDKAALIEIDSHETGHTLMIPKDSNRDPFGTIAE